MLFANAPFLQFLHFLLLCSFIFFFFYLYSILILVYINAVHMFCLAVFLRNSQFITIATATLPGSGNPHAILQLNNELYIFMLYIPYIDFCCLYISDIWCSIFYKMITWTILICKVTSILKRVVQYECSRVKKKKSHRLIFAF